MRTHEVLPFIFAKMRHLFKGSISCWQSRFLCEAFRVLFAMQGRVTFANLERYSSFSERTFRRHFVRFFDWIAFNLTMAEQVLHPQERVIGVFDTSFIEKAGKKTFGLDLFFNTKQRRNRYGLEVSLIGLLGRSSGRLVGLDVTQTPPALGKENTYTRTDFYLEQLHDCLHRLEQAKGVFLPRHWVGDGFYAKARFFKALVNRGYHLISRLRSDADLRFLADPLERGPTNRPRRYAGKVDFSVLNDPIRLQKSRFQAISTLEDYPHIELYTARVNSGYMKQDLRIVVLYSSNTSDYAVLASSDLEQDPEEIVSDYRSRYQIELFFRDAKQYTGLSHAQARDENKLDFHFNFSVAGINLARLIGDKHQLSLRSLMREHYNRFIVEQLMIELGQGAESEVWPPGIQRIIQIGRVSY